MSSVKYAMDYEPKNRFLMSYGSCKVILPGEHITVLYLTATITSSIKLNNLDIQYKKYIQVMCVAEVQPSVIWRRHQPKRVYFTLDRENMNNTGGCYNKKSLTMESSTVQGLHPRLTSLLHNPHISSQAYQPCCNCLNECNKRIQAYFSILANEKALRLCWDGSSS